jgi:hypothetical protein
MGSKYGCLIGAGVLIGFFILVAIAGSSNPTAPTSDEAADPSDILKNKEFLAKSPGYPEAITNLIRERGFECPKLQELWAKGESPYGLKLEALCGPENSDDVYPAMHYTIYPDHFQVVLCKPFGMFAGGCD